MMESVPGVNKLPMKATIVILVLLYVVFLIIACEKPSAY